MTRKILVIGAGISGCTLAERYANIKNCEVTIIDKRDHIGGNCYDYYDDAGIRISKYGAHLFHTKHEDVWKYVQKFSKWYPYIHKVVASVDGKLVPVPVNINTVNILLDKNIKNEKEMKNWLDTNTVKIINPKNGEEAALRRVGKVLYEKIFKNYTIKQWGQTPKELDPEILDRIPIRTNFDNNYFSDKYQSLPKEGYNKMFEKMLRSKNINVVLNTSWKDIKNSIKNYEKIFFTGPIDQFFNYNLKKKLEYRSLKFTFETHNKEFFQEYPVINYPNEHSYTRIVEYKWFTGQKNPKTTISKEYPTNIGEPYYPILNDRNKKIYLMYYEKAKEVEKDGIYFVGRLANFKYFNMDEAFKNALDLFNKLENHGK